MVRRSRELRGFPLRPPTRVGMSGAELGSELPSWAVQRMRTQSASVQIERTACGIEQSPRGRARPLVAPRREPAETAWSTILKKRSRRSVPARVQPADVPSTGPNTAGLVSAGLNIHGCLKPPTSTTAPVCTCSRLVAVACPGSRRSTRRGCVVPADDRAGRPPTTLDRAVGCPGADG